MAYDKERIGKILRMLESEHDGECAAAARRLTAMAKAEGHNLLEMMVAAYGGSGSSYRERCDGPSHSSKKSSRASQDDQNFEDLMRDMMQRGFEQAKAAEAFRRAAEEQMRRQREARRPARHPKVQLAHDLAEALGVHVLTPWEIDFLFSVRNETSLSARQVERLDEIIEKLQRIKASRDRDAEAWGWPPNR